MADSLVSRHIPALYNGVSQQNPTLRQPSQAEAQVNLYGTVMDGLRKRPPFQYIATVTTADISTAHVHTINRDVAERYIVVVTPGDLKVYDADTGAEKTVAFPTGKAYLATASAANESFSLDSIADYTFVVNKTITTATKTTPTSTPTYYNDWYQPGSWRPRVAEHYFSSAGAGSLTGTVNTFSDLPSATDPSPPSEGHLYKVVGYDETNFGGYYVRRTGGVWEEHYGPGANLTLDEDTLPHALVRETDGTFTFTPFSWKARQFGDAETNPPPTFVGRTINGVFYWKNRLGFLTDENVVFSTAGDYGNFFRNTMTTLLDSDVVDVAVSTNKVSILKYAIPFNQSMMLFADQTQFSLNVADLLTPTSVSIDEATSYEMDAQVRPVAIGTEVYFTGKTGTYSRLREYFVHSEGLTTDAADTTAHAQRYVPADIIKLAGNDIEDCVFAISSKAGYENRIYTYKFFWQGDEKVQSAWSYWELGSDDVLLSIDCIEQTLYALIKRADGTFLEKCELDSGAVTGSLDFDILLDRRYAVQPGDMVYSAGNDETTITLPYDVVDAEESSVRVVTSVGTGNVGRLVDTTDYTVPPAPVNTLVVAGDLTGTAPYVGMAYDATYTFSEQFVYDQNANADTTGRLQLRTFTITYSDTAFFETTVYPYGTDFTANVEEVVTSALDAFTGRQLGEAQLTLDDAAFHTGDYTFYIDGTSTDVVVQLTNPSHLQSKFLSCQWEGSFTKRTQNA